MAATLPFLTNYDPAGTSEGNLDPLGLVQIGEQLANLLVPAVRERMLRIRFLTASAVGALVTEGLDDDPAHRDASPYLVWEWLLVEALVRTPDLDFWGVPGTVVARHALQRHGYLDARSYLKTPRIFGFFGVYKRLALHLGLIDVHLGPGPNAQALVDAWARGRESNGHGDTRALIGRWSETVKRCLREDPPRTRAKWASEDWAELAQAFLPDRIRAQEKRFLRELLLGEGERSMGALPKIWQLQDGFDDDSYSEEPLHDQLGRIMPHAGNLLAAIRAYERFARCLQDAFDLIRAEASQSPGQGFAISSISRDSEFKTTVKPLHELFEVAHRALGEVTVTAMSPQNLFGERFAVFGEPLDTGAIGLALCHHHELIQRAKSMDGKRPWFDRAGGDRLFIRPAYRIARRECEPDRYVNPYRGRPIRRFYLDLK
jgi:hypothetical protein